VTPLPAPGAWVKWRPVITARSATILSVLLVGVLTAAALAQGQPPQPGQPPAPAPPDAPAPASSHPSAAAIGLEFRDPVTMDAVEQVEAGNAQGAVDLVNEALKDRTITSDERRRELIATLGLVYLRSSAKELFAKARPTLGPLAQRDDGTSLGPRCQVLLAAAARVSKVRPESRDRFIEQLKERDAWLELLATLRRDLEDQFRTLHDEARKEAQEQRWERVARPAHSAGKKAAMIDVIQVRDAESVPDILMEHARQTAMEIEEIQRGARQHYQAGVSLREEIDSERVRRDAGRFSLIDTYNSRHRSEIPPARDAARALQDELRTLQSRCPRLRALKVPAFTVEDLPRIEKD
jgi:hypothetical protein